MSLIIHLSSPNSAPDPVQKLGWSAPRFHIYDQGSTGSLESMAGRIDKPAMMVRKSTIGRKVIRRLKGFVVALNGQETRVAFLQDGKTVTYDLPSDSLKKKGITALHQPFEMDEVSLKVEPYDAVTAYEFRPLATKDDAFPETLSLNSDRVRKRDLIFRKFGKTAG